MSGIHSVSWLSLPVSAVTSQWLTLFTEIDYDAACSLSWSSSISWLRSHGSGG